MKPTVFFSHSSKDKEPILILRNLLDKKTGGSLDIFMSSDGQSVPFGSNWIHKLEEKLNDAKIMFVFVTDNSVKSGWTYFEAGYAYSKEIKVVPIGIGIDIETIGGPLGLLQGFNLLSYDSMNNIISIINQTFEFHFEESYTESDFSEVMNSFPQLDKYAISVEDVVKYAAFELKSKYKRNESVIEYNIDEYFHKIVTYLNDNKIEFSTDNHRENREVTVIVARGITINYYHKREKDPESFVDQGDEAKISFQVSPFNFENCFSLLVELMKLREGNHNRYIKMVFQDNITCVTAKEDISAILSNYPDEFSLDAGRKDSYICNELGISFQLFEYNGSSQYSPFKAIYINYNCTQIDAICVLRLLNRLFEIKLIKYGNIPAFDGSYTLRN